MFYSRDKGGAIDGCYADRQSFPCEKLPDDHPDVMAWRAKLAPPPKPRDLPAELDALKARIAKLEGAR